jgi:hypothetical protein
MHWTVRWCAPLLVACSRFGAQTEDAMRTSEDGGREVAASDAGIADDGGDAGSNCAQKTTGFRSPSVLENFGPGEPWTNEDAGAAQDNQTTSTVIGGGKERTATLVASGFGLALPSSARIDGVRVRIRHKATTTEIHDAEVKLAMNKTTMGSNEAKPDGWGYAFSEFEYGSERHLWSLELTPAFLNAPAFGVALAAELRLDAGTHGVYVDVIRIEVAYCD